MKRKIQTYLPNAFINKAISQRGQSYGGIKASVSLGFYYPAKRLMGLAENENSFSMLLKNTDEMPFEMYNTDYYAHPIGS
jgi:hypothetical protein